MVGMNYSINNGVAEHKSINGRLIAAAMAVVFAGSLVAALTVSAEHTDTVTVTPDDTQGWVNGDVRPGGSVDFTEAYGAPEGFGNGSLELATTDGSAKAQYVKPLDEAVSLTGVNDIAYSTYRSSATTGSDVQAPAVNLVIDYNGDETGGFATLVFEPVYNTDQGQIVDGEWQNWIADNSSTWWSTKAMPGVPQAFNSFVSLQSIKDANPDAVVSAVILNQGSGNPGLVYGVDALTFNGTTYDFEVAQAAPNSKDECKKGGYEAFGFKNQGQCIASVQSNSKHNR